ILAVQVLVEKCLPHGQRLGRDVLQDRADDGTVGKGQLAGTRRGDLPWPREHDQFRSQFREQPEPGTGAEKAERMPATQSPQTSIEQRHNSVLQTGPPGRDITDAMACESTIALCALSLVKAQPTPSVAIVRT